MSKINIRSYYNPEPIAKQDISSLVETCKVVDNKIVRGDVIDVQQEINNCQYNDLQSLVERNLLLDSNDLQFLDISTGNTIHDVAKRQRQLYEFLLKCEQQKKLIELELNKVNNQDIDKDKVIDKDKNKEKVKDKLGESINE